MTQSSLKSFRDTLEAIVVALLLAFVIRAFIVQAFKIPSGSMLET
ncbi:MAG TPA: S26 family signal peptidase, partial [Pseudodesulfovibrio sp.]|nr:S26 family signal peptidase [Pseudodesulfovibrio sp.]